MLLATFLAALATVELAAQPQILWVRQPLHSQSDSKVLITAAMIFRSGTMIPISRRASSSSSRRLWLPMNIWLRSRTIVRVCRRIPFSLRMARPLVLRVTLPMMRTSIPCFGSFFEQPGHRPVRDLHVINEQLFFGALDKRGQLLSRIQRADQEPGTARSVGLSLGVAFEKLYPLPAPAGG